MFEPVLGKCLTEENYNDFTVVLLSKNNMQLIYWRSIYNVIRGHTLSKYTKSLYKLYKQNI